MLDFWTSPSVQLCRVVFAKTAGSQRGEGGVEIIGAESQMATVVVDVAGPEGAGRMDDQMHLHGAPQVSQAPAALKGGRSIECEVEQVPIERLATAGDQ